MKIYDLLSAIEEEQSPAMLQMGIAKDRKAGAELDDLINNLSDIRQHITTPNVEELKKRMIEKEEIISKAEILEKKLKSYEEAEKERIVSQENLARMKETIAQRNNADERFEGFSGVQYIEETGALIGQYGAEAVKLEQLNRHLNDDRAEYHRCKAEHFSLLGEIESCKEKIDKLQHIDTEKGDTVLTLDHMITTLRELKMSLSSSSTEQEDFSAMMVDTLKMLKPFVSMLEVKLKDYAAVLPEKFLKEIYSLIV
ncbi:MAG: hypothetical protein HDR27_09890 [Lachnospiraceae bacterium]|nr:hypothetical protein [Lachnospiraceae bacterium]